MLHLLIIMKLKIVLCHYSLSLINVFFFRLSIEVVNEVDKQFRPSRLVRFDDVFVTSAKRRVNTESLKTRLRELLDLYADIALAKHSPVCDVQTDVVEQYGQRGV